MPHADYSFVPPTIDTKTEFWIHVQNQLASLLEGQRNWVTNLANASSLIYNSLLAFPLYFGQDDSAVNWCGFYLDSSLLPGPHIIRSTQVSLTDRLVLGPFCGKPACQFIDTGPERARGACADAFCQRRTLVIPNVELYPGHIACDSETKSEIVCPLILRQDKDEVVLGVLDLDCLAEAGFDEDDRAGLEKIAQLIVNTCDW